MKTTEQPTGVRVSRFTESRVVPIEFREGMTVGDALKAAEMSPERGESILVRGKPAEADTPLTEGDTVTLTNKPTGGR